MNTDVIGKAIQALDLYRKKQKVKKSETDLLIMELQFLQNDIIENTHRFPEIRKRAEELAQAVGYSIDPFTNMTRKGHVVDKRHVIIYTLFEEFRKSKYRDAMIAYVFGKHRTSVINSIAMTRRLISGKDRDMLVLVDMIKIANCREKDIALADVA